MDKAVWMDAWHAVLAVIAYQSPFAAIMLATAFIFIVVMAIEGTRHSLAAIWHAHRATAPAPPPSLAEPPPLEEPVAMAAPAPAAPLTRAFTPRPSIARKRKAMTATARQFRSPRPTIRRQVLLAPAETRESF
jgi:hypothetical protein